MVWPTLGSRTAKEQNRTEQSLKYFYYSVRCAYVAEAKKGIDYGAQSPILGYTNYQHVDF